jgi:PhnB protein
MYATPYIFFNGNCAEALRYYEKVLGAKVEFSMTYGQSPAASHVAKEMHDKVIHARLMVGNTAILASDDGSPNASAGKHGGYSLTLSVDTPQAADKIFHALADGGEVTMKLDKTFFAERFGSVHDRYGVRWMVICEKPIA